MISMSKPISASQAQAYHKEEFANARDNYYSEGDHVRGEWQGQLAERYGLAGEVGEEQFARLSEGQHPATGEQLVRHQTAREYVNEQGQTMRTMEHRAGWDATFSAPKSVSVTALVGQSEDGQATRTQLHARPTPTTIERSSIPNSANLPTRYRGEAAADLLLLSTPQIFRAPAKPYKTQHIHPNHHRPTPADNSTPKAHNEGSSPKDQIHDPVPP